MTDSAPCRGCGKLTPEDENHYLLFCPSCLKGAGYFSVREELGYMPAGVTLDDGRQSGERLRQMLEARMHRCPLTIDMDSTLGYGSSFLEAAFTALGARSAIPPEHFTIRCSDSSIVKEVEGYIRQQTSPLLDRIEDRQLKEREQNRLKDQLHKACTEWDEDRHSKEALVARILSILPDPKAHLKPWRKARHKTRLGTYWLRRTRNGWDVREEGMNEHQSGVSPSYVDAEFEFLEDV